MGLYEKIFKVMEESTALDKNMDVGTGNYNYKAISEAEVLNKIKPLLKKHKLILFPIEADAIISGKITQITAKYKIVDVESGESEVLATVGNGADTQDKGSGKAWTYAYKALVQKTFCLFSGEDTDNTHSNDIEEQENKVTTKMLTDIILKNNLTTQQYIDWYNEKYEKNITDIKFMSQTVKRHVYNKLNEKGEK